MKIFKNCKLAICYSNYVNWSKCETETSYCDDHGVRINLGCITLLTAIRKFSLLSQNEFRVYFAVERKAIMFRVLGVAGFETWTGDRPS